MLDQARQRTDEFLSRLNDSGINTALITDESSIAYLAGFWGYLSVEFGRPTFVLLQTGQMPLVITPLMESEMVSRMTWIDNVRTWEDSGPNRWEAVLERSLPKTLAHIGVEKANLPAIVRNWFDDQLPDCRLEDISPLLNELRMKQTGKIAAAMMHAAEDALAEGVPEYEAALAVINAGTRQAATFLTARGWDAFISPMIHNLQIMQSGRDTSMVHRRASVKPFEKGDPVYFCFCNMAQFKQYKLGFDRMFFIKEISDEAIKVQQTAIDAQQAAIAAIKPGVRAEYIAQVANEVYRANGYETGYRTGRSIGMSYLESPELKEGDKTILKAGMTFAVDGGISVDGRLGGRIGDSIVVTDSGADYLTDYARTVLVVNE
jgi:Xaa-Pro aminopeptidase